MTDQYRVVLDPRVARQLATLGTDSQRDPAGAAARTYAIALGALGALRAGREAEYDGERLG